MMEGNIFNILISKYDVSDHYRHHLYYVVNYGDSHMDKMFGTEYKPVI